MALTKEDLQEIANLLDQKLEPINNRIDKVEDRLDKIEYRADKADSVFDKISAQVSVFRAGQIDMRKEIKAVDIKISETYRIALEAWEVSTENRKWFEAVN